MAKQSETGIAQQNNKAHFLLGKNSALKHINYSPTLAQDVKIQGTVTAQESGDPIPGANILIKGTSAGTITDLEGNYAIQSPEEGVLVFSFIGYDSQEVPVQGRNVINVELVPSLSSLDEVVVIGYGTTTQANLSGSVSTVDVDKVMGSRPAINVASLLEGQVSGVFIHQNS